MSRTGGAFTSVATTGVVVAIVAGCGGSGGERTRQNHRRSTRSSRRRCPRIPDFESPAEPIDAALSTPPTDPIEAVRNYSGGEVHGEVERSYAALSSVDLDRAPARWPTGRRPGSSARGSWTSRSIQRIRPAGRSGRGHRAWRELTLEPRLDEVSGFVPSTPTSNGRSSPRTADGGSISIDSSLDPILPDEHGATGSRRALGRSPSAVPRRRRVRGLAARFARARRPAVRLDGELVAGPPAPLDDAMCDPGRRRLRA